MLKQNLKDGDLNTMWSGGVAGTNSYKTWSPHSGPEDAQCRALQQWPHPLLQDPKSTWQMLTMLTHHARRTYRMSAGPCDSMARLALRQRRGPFQLKPPGTWVPLSLFYNVWCPSPTRQQNHRTGHVHNPISVLQTRALNMFAATLTLQRVWLQGAMKIQLMFLPQSTYYS